MSTLQNIPQRKKESLVDQVIKSILNGESQDKIKQKISIALNTSNNDKINKIYEIARRNSGVDYKVSDPNLENKSVVQEQLNEIIENAIGKIEEGKDAENVINDTENRLERLKISKDKINSSIQKIYDFFDYDTSEKKKDEIQLEDAEDIIPLPRVDIDYDELKNIKLQEDEDEDIIPPLDRPLITQDNFKRSEDYAREIKNNGNGQKVTDKIFKTNSKLVVETQKLEDFIRQVKVCAITLPVAISKLKMEDLLIKFLQRVPEKFNNMYVFGWETQRNTEYYKSFDKIMELNQESDGALFIIRDIKTFNIFAAEIFRGIPKNYYLILLQGMIRKDDLVTIENLTNDSTFLWPSFAQLKVNIKTTVDVSFLYGDHAKNYENSILLNYRKPEIGMKEAYSSLDRNSELVNVGRKLLNVDLSIGASKDPKVLKQLVSLSKPGLSLDESIRRSPKFRNIIISILANSDSRILLKLSPGDTGIEAFLYMYEKLKKTPLKPLIIRREENFEIKRTKAKSIPDQGPCLIVTDYILSDVLIPNNIEKFYIGGGGEWHDMETIFDLCKAEHYSKNIYPRNIEIKNFITKIDVGIIETIDEIDYDEFDTNLSKSFENLKKIRDSSLQMIIMDGDKLGVRKQDF